MMICFLSLFCQGKGVKIETLGKGLMVRVITQFVIVDSDGRA
jgi:hypothetical protein